MVWNYKKTKSKVACDRLQVTGLSPAFMVSPTFILSQCNYFQYIKDIEVQLLNSKNEQNVYFMIKHEIWYKCIFATLVQDLVIEISAP